MTNYFSAKCQKTYFNTTPCTPGVDDPSAEHERHERHERDEPEQQHEPQEHEQHEVHKAQQPMSRQRIYLNKKIRRKKRKF